MAGLAGQPAKKREGEELIYKRATRGASSLVRPVGTRSWLLFAWLTAERAEMQPYIPRIGKQLLLYFTVQSFTLELVQTQTCPEPRIL